MSRTLRAVLAIVVALLVPLAAFAEDDCRKVSPKGKTLKEIVEGLRSVNTSRFIKADAAASTSASAVATLTKQSAELQKELDQEKKVDVVERDGCNDEGVVCLTPQGSLYEGASIRDIDAGASLTVKVIGSEPDIVNQSITITSRLTRDKVWAPGAPSTAASSKPPPDIEEGLSTPGGSLDAKGTVEISADQAKALAKEQAKERDIDNPPGENDVAKWKTRVEQYYQPELACWKKAIADRTTKMREDADTVTSLEKKIATLKEDLAKEKAKHAVSATQTVTTDTTSTWVEIRYRADRKISETETRKDDVSRQHIVRVRQGRYFIELSVGLAFVLGGDRTVKPVAEVGSGEQRLTVDRNLRVSPTFNVNWFIFGREMNRVSVVPTAPGARADILGLFGLQFGTTLNLANRALDEWYFGLVLEPVTGFAMSAGIAALKGQFLPSGTYEGQLVPHGTSFTPDTKYMPKGYLGVSVSLDILDTISRAFTTARSPGS